ncbi:DMT family transporter [Shewanella olleyana]|uniref:DMT family transporter n=1 Tax=Shewanella olleyana TaxID=135626 RepID=UPI00200D1D4B|nr:DMT family transporter [Shewanella olleyana]MCL1066319.1 DMT family transporter [Shewanella olleyana]
MKTLVYTLFALLAFAGNSILCRVALGNDLIDPASFTAIRLLSGVAVLVIIMQLARFKRVKFAGELSQQSQHSSNHASAGLISYRPQARSKGSWKAALMLFVYALTFSYAYTSLDTGTGALILFGAVQITMIVVGAISGQKLHFSEWFGVMIAFSGFVYLVMPGASAPSISGFVLMAVSGVAWGFYTLEGKQSSEPISDTSYNFIRTLPLVIILSIATIPFSTITPTGILLTIISGGLASAVGYVIWYAALAGLTGIQASVVQLLVPVIAAIGGVIFADEVFSLRLGISSLVILSGIMIVLLGKHYLSKR